MANPSQTGFGQQSGFSFSAAESDSQLSNLASTLFGLGLNDPRRQPKPAHRAHRFNPPTGPRAGSEPTFDKDGDIDIGGTGKRQRLTAKETRRLREAEQRQSILSRKRDAEQYDFSHRGSKRQNRQSSKKAQLHRRNEQKAKLDAILASPIAAAERSAALKRLHALAQEVHLSTTNKQALKQQLRTLAFELSPHTEKTGDELYSDLCQTSHIKLAETIVSDSPFAQGSQLPSAFTQSDKARQAHQTALSRKAQKDAKRNAFLSIQSIRPKFKILAPTTEQKTQDRKNWDKARPLVARLQTVLQEKPRNELEVVYAYAAARQPVKILAKGLLREYDEVLIECVPSLSKDDIAKYDKPFADIEEAERRKKQAEKEANEPKLPDLSTLNFNDITDAFSRPWSTKAPEEEEL